MAQFLSLNGITFPVADRQARRGVFRRGSKGRSRRGQKRDGSRGNRREWQLRTCFSTFEEAEALIGLAHGEGHLAYFTEGFGTKSALTPEVCDLDGCTWNPSEGPFTGFDTGAFCTEGGGVHLRYDAQLCEDWTIHYWFREGTDPWQVLTKRDDGLTYLDGSRNDAQWDMALGNIRVDVIDGRVEIVGDFADLTCIHHLGMLPFRVPVSFIEAWQATGTPWGSVPALRAEGDILLTDHEVVLGAIDGVDYVGAAGADIVGIGWVKNVSVIDFTIREAATAWRADNKVP